MFLWTSAGSDCKTDDVFCAAPCESAPIMRTVAKTAFFMAMAFLLRSKQGSAVVKADLASEAPPAGNYAFPQMFFEPAWGQRGVARGRVGRTMAKIGLQSVGIDAFIGQRVPADTPKHAAVDRESRPDALAQ